MIHSANSVRPGRILALMIPILLIALFLRVHYVGIGSLSRDEMATWGRIAQPNLYEAMTHGAVDSMWPGYHIPLYAFARVAGDSEFALRLVSVLAGTLALAVLYQVGRRLYSPREGVMAALFAAVVGTEIVFSQTARSYAMLLLFSLLSVYTWLELLRACDRGQQRPWRLAAAYAFSAVMVIYLHLFGAFLVAVEGLGALVWMWNRRQPQRVVLAAFGAAFVGVIPIALTIPATMDVYNGWITPVGSLLEAATAYVLTTFSIPRPSLVTVIVLCGALLVAGISQKRRSAPVVAGLPPPTWLLILWVILPIGGLYLFSILVKPAFVPRYISYTLPAVFLLVAHLINRLRVGLGWKAGLAVCVASVLVANSLPALSQSPSRDDSNIRLAARDMAELESQYPDMLFIWYAGRGQTNPDFEYYLRQAGSSRHPDVRGGLIETIPDVQAALDARKPHYVWFFRMATPGDAGFRPFLDSVLVEVDHRSYGKLDLWTYKNPAAPQ